jgi:hypothetical protein
MAENTTIRFSDLRERDLVDEARLRQREAHLEDLKKKRGGKLPPAEEAELDDLKAVNKVLEKDQASPQEVAHSLFVAVRDLFNAKPEHLGDARRRVQNFDKDGKLHVSVQFKKGAWQDDLDFENVVRISLVMGLLADDGVAGVRLVKDKPDPAVGDSEIVANVADLGPVKRAFYAALGEMDDNWALARRVLDILDEEGDPTGKPKTAGSVKCLEFARVVRRLVSSGVKPDEPQLRRRVNDALDTLQALGDDKPLKDVGIELPDLNDVTNYEIQRDNVEAMGPMICSAMFDELKAFDVVDKLVELWQGGVLPVGRSQAGELLYKYWRDAPNRMSETERRNFYAITMGVPGGNVNGASNREFNDLWIRFVSSVSSLVRQKTVESLLRQGIPASIGQQQVRKSARDLALNLSRYGYGMVVFAAVDLQKQISTMIKLLGHEDIRGAYGARDMWQVIDQVATLELGGARNSARYRTLAICGAIITKWLAKNVDKFNRATSLEPIIDLDAVVATSPASSGRNATSDPTDYDLVNACELWLADTAVGDDRIEQMSQPREAPVMTSRPVQIPSIAREMLEQAGVPNLPGLGLGMGLPRH